MMYIAFSYRML